MLKSCGALERALGDAESHVDRALDHLAVLPNSEARDSLEMLALAALLRGDVKARV